MSHTLDNSAHICAVDKKQSFISTHCSGGHFLNDNSELCSGPLKSWRASYVQERTVHL